MENRNEIKDELKALAPKLSALDKQNAFNVPENYFSKLPTKLLAKIKEDEAWENAAEPELSPLLQSLKGKQTFSLPNNYFGATSANVLSKIRTEEVKTELRELAPQLATLPKQLAFKVPRNYFATLPARVLQQVSTEEKSENTPLSLWNEVNSAIDRILLPLFKPQLAYAFATLFSFAIAIWFLQTGSKPKFGNTTSLENQLEQISSDEVNSYIAMNFDEFDEQTLKKKIGEINSVVIFDEKSIDQKNLEEIILRELDEDMILELQKTKNKNSVI